MREIFELVQLHHWNGNYIENLYPWELGVYIDMLIEKLKERNK